MKDALFFWDRVIYPAFILGAILLHLLLVEALSPHFGILAFSAASMMSGLSAIAVAIVLERKRPYLPSWNTNQKDFVADFLLTMMIFPFLLMAVEKSLRFLLAENGVEWRMWPSEWPILLQALLALVISDLTYYWVHWSCHKLDVLWRLHRIHHGSERIYWANSGRFHPLELLIAAPIWFGPILFLGINAEAFALFITLNSVIGMLEHANIRYSAGVWNWFFNSAELHRWHHALGERPVNFGKNLSIFDRLFGSLLLPNDRKVTRVGNPADVAPVSKDFLGLLRDPFR